METEERTQAGLCSSSEAQKLRCALCSLLSTTAFSPYLKSPFWSTQWERERATLLNEAAIRLVYSKPVCAFDVHRMSHLSTPPEAHSGR